MYSVCYDITSISRNMPDWLLCELNAAAVHGLAAIDEVILRHYMIPSIYQVAPRYHIPIAVERGIRKERWKDIAAVLQDGWGDCKDFTAWRLAELWRENIDAKAESILYRDMMVFHTYVRYPDGRIEDVAKRLGMP
jgi:hypothetical protein